MELFDSGHFLTFFGDLDTIGDTYEPLAFPQRIEELQTHLNPQFGEFVQLQASAMEHV
jgi:hypothetical protein